MSDNKNKSNSKIWQLELANKNMELEISARKQIERSLKNREDRFKTIFSHAPITYFLCDVEGAFLDGNLAASELTGYNNEEIFGKTFIELNLIDKNDISRILALLSRSALGENTGPDELCLNKKDGSKVIIELSTSPVIIHEQKQILGIAQDITDRKLIQTDLEESEERFRKLFDSAHDALMTLAPPNFKFTSGNPAILNMYKVKNIEEFLTYGPWDVSPKKQPDGRLSSDKAKEMIEIAMTTGSKYFEWTHMRMTGESFPTTVLLTRIQLKNETFLQATVRDVTKQKQTENAIKASEKKYRDLFEKSEDAILIIKNGNFVDCNKSTIKMLRYKDKNEFLNTHPSELSPEKQPDGILSYEKADEMMAIAIKKGSHRFEWDHKRSDGEVFPVEVLLTAISTDENNQIIHTVWRDITDRKKADLELIQSEERFKSLFDDLGDAVYVTKTGGDERGKILEVNKAAETQTGYTRKELLKMNIIKDIYISGSGEIKADDWEEQLSRGKIVDTIEKKKRKNGQEFWTSVIVTSIQFKGETAGLSINHDITDRLRREKELVYSEEKYRSLTENLPLGIYRNTRGAKGKFLEVNQAFIDMFGFKDRESMLSASASSLYVSPTSRLAFSDKLTKYGSVKNEEIRLLRQDGSTFVGSITAIAVKNEYGKVIHYDGMIEDITERAELGMKLSENEEKFRSIVSNSPCVIMQTDRNGLISFINYTYSGQDPINIIGKTIYDFMPHEFHEVARNTIKNVFKTGESQSFENLGFSSDESVVWYKNTVSSIHKNNKVSGVAILAADISEQKQSDIMKTEFISSISHELRTPLTIIRESLSLLSDELYGKLNKDQAGIINPCIEDVDRLGRIINNMLDISRMEGQKIKIEREVVDIVKLAQGVVSSFSNKALSKNIELKFTSNKESINLYLDNDRIVQVFLNLIGNAVKFTEKGKIEVFVTEKNDHIECCIEDSGQGIDKKNLGTIFDRFHQVGKVMRAGEVGSGLGLSISKGIIKLHKGKIWVSSKQNKGSKFYFTLPQYNPGKIILENLEKEIFEADKNHAKLSLLLIRLNNYSIIESELGVGKVQKVIKQILHAIQDELAPGDFTLVKEKNEVLLLSDITRQNIAILFSKLNDMLSESVLNIDKNIKVDLSIGHSIYPNDAKISPDLIEKAYISLNKR